MLPNQPLCGMLWSMTDTLTPTLLASLQEVSDPFCLSLFLPTHRTGDLEQDQVRLKNLLKDAAEKLCTAGMRKPDVDALLERAHALLKDGLFWRHLEDGLAIFAAKNHCTILRLPLALPEESIIDDHFHTEHIVSIALGAHKHFFLRGKLAEDFSNLRSRVSVENLFAVLWDNDHVILAGPDPLTPPR